MVRVIIAGQTFLLQDGEVVSAAPWGGWGAEGRDQHLRREPGRFSRCHPRGAQSRSRQVGEGGGGVFRRSGGIG